MKHHLKVATLVAALVLATAVTAGAQSWPLQINSPVRFRVLTQFNSEAVLDLETGLVWDRTPSTTLHAWNVFPTAHIMCNVRRTGNRQGWRLPTIQELASLLDPTRFHPSLPAGHPFILSAAQKTGEFWSASTAATDATSPNSAWFISFLLDPDSLVLYGAGDKTTPRFLWCVRGGQGVDPQ